MGRGLSVAYDDQGRIERVADHTGRGVGYTYDGAGNLTRMELPVVNGERPTFDYTVNSRGQVSEIDGAEGRRWAFSFDPATGDALSITVDPGGLDMTGQVAYDAVGNMTNKTDARGQRRTYAYDDNRRLVKSVAPPSFSLQTRFEYDDDGNVTKIRRATGDAGSPWQDVSVSYNQADNALSGIRYAFSNGLAAFSYSYDDRGRNRKRRS